jgi:uncharacterized protein
MQEPEFEWDRAKASNNLIKHGITFEYATHLFFAPRFRSVDASRPEDREVRRKAIGILDGRLLVVVYVERGGAYRIVSARRANVKEKRLWSDLSSIPMHHRN